MSSRLVKRKHAPGAQSAQMTRYLGRLANNVCVSQLEEPCTYVKLSATYSNNPKVDEPQSVINTVDRYFVKKSVSTYVPDL